MSEAPKSHRIAAPRINNNINVRSSCVNLDFCTCLPFLVIATGEWSPRPFCGAEVRSWPITSFVPFCVWRLPVEADTRYLGGPASGGVALYLAAKRPLDRVRERSRPIGVTVAPPRASAGYATRASMTQTIRTGATVACMLHRGSRINLYPVERQRLVPKSCVLVAARLQDCDPMSDRLVSAPAGFHP